MAFTSGTVTKFSGPNGLLQALLNFVTGDPLTPGRDWTLLSSENTKNNVLPYSEPFGAGCRQVILKNTGISKEESVIIGIREWYYKVKAAHGWDLNGYLYHQDGLDWNLSRVHHGCTAYDATWHHYTQHPMIPLIDDTMYYWFYSNPRRIIVVVKVQSNYESVYLGFGRRFGNPSDYPTPLAVIGSTFGNRTFTDTSGAHNFIIAPNYFRDHFQHWIVDPSNAYRICQGYQTYAERGAVIIPRGDYNDRDTIKRTPAGDNLITPCYVAQPVQNDLFMDLDGVYHVVGNGVQSEDTVKWSGGTLRVFQNVFRTTHFDFMGIDES